MNLRLFAIVGGSLVVAMVLISAWAWPQIPGAAQVPIHWGPDGEIDGYAPKAIGLLMVPAISLALLGLLALVPRIEPRRENLQRSGSAYVAVGITVMAFLAAIHVVVVLVALGNDVDLASIAILGTGAMFVVIGNFLGKTRSNWFFGIRTPWTLSSELSWSRTHRVGGWLFIAVGLLVIAGAVILGPELSVWLMLGSLLASVAGLVAYSYVVWRDDPARAGAKR
jgi:uncharacterized membrane protein